MARAMLERMRAKRRPLRASFVVTFSAGALAACGGSEQPIGNPIGVLPDASPDGNPSGCPAAPPSPQTACASEGLSCQYGSSCSPTTYECNSGVWTAFHGNPPAFVCPATPPSGPCPCVPQNVMCPYGMCNGQPSDYAVCVGGQWSMQAMSCNPPVPLPDAGMGDGAVSDASSDAKRTD